MTVTGITASNKVYDQSFAATVNTTNAALAGTIYPGDQVTLVTTGAMGVFISKPVANGTTVTTVGLTLSGAEAGRLHPDTADDHGQHHAAAPLTVTGITAQNKLYNRLNPAVLNTRVKRHWWESSMAIP